MGRERRLLLAVGLTVMLGGTLALAAGVLAALPALLAFLPLLAGRYLGADRLGAAIERLRGELPRPVAATPRPRTPGHTSLVRGGRLIAASLAKRPPPALAAAV